MNNNSAARIFNMNLLSNKIKCKGDRVQKICLARNIDINNMILMISISNILNVIFLSLSKMAKMEQLIPKNSF